MKRKRKGSDWSFNYYFLMRILTLFYYCVLIIFIIPCSSIYYLVLWLSKKKVILVYCIFILYSFSSSYQWQEDSSLLKCFLCGKILKLNIYFVGLTKPEIKWEAYFVLEKICAYGCMFGKHPQKKFIYHFKITVRLAFCIAYWQMKGQKRYVIIHNLCNLLSTKFLE